MVLLAGDLFHDNKPSRKSMYQVMRSLRMNCLGEKPCELEMLSDASEAFQGCVFCMLLFSPDRTDQPGPLIMSTMKTRTSTWLSRCSPYTAIMTTLPAYALFYL